LLLPHPLDIVAILLGVFLLIRKTEVRSDDPAHHPGVALADFEEWRRRALAAYTIGTRACFGKVFIDFLFLAFLRRVSVDAWLRTSLGVSLDVAWVVLLVVCWLRARSAHRFKSQLGIRLPDTAPT
jgi:hypothetical protein